MNYYISDAQFNTVNSIVKRLLSRVETLRLEELKAYDQAHPESIEVEEEEKEAVLAPVTNADDEWESVFEKIKSRKVRPGFLFYYFA